MSSLAQLALKLTVPGVPDIYQGTELWDFSLVDPDNRVPVDFAVRQNSLEGGLLEKIASNWMDGRIKQFIIARVLAVRRKMPTVFLQGAYVPVEVAGSMSRHFVAFARIDGSSHAIVVVCRAIARLLSKDKGLHVSASHWKDTRILIPKELQGTFSDALAPKHQLSIGAEIGAGEIFTALPIAFLTNY